MEMKIHYVTVSVLSTKAFNHKQINMLARPCERTPGQLAKTEQENLETLQRRAQKELKHDKNNCSSVIERSSISGFYGVPCGMLQCKAWGTAVVSLNKR